jgi:hypothetical protein
VHDAVHELSRGDYESSFINYAVAFEMFVQRHLEEKSDVLVGVDGRTTLLKRMRSIEERVTTVLTVAVGRSLAAWPSYTDWKESVQTPRNLLLHGEPVTLGVTEVEKAHSAVCGAIYWMLTLGV